MNQDRYAEASWLSRRLALNSLFTIIAVCAMCVGSIALSLHQGQTVINRVTSALAVAFAGPDR